MTAHARGAWWANLAATVRRRPITIFFLLACAISWPGFFIHGLGRVGLPGWTPPAELPLLSEYGPSLAALLVSLAEGGWAAGKRLLARGLIWRVHPIWYVVVLFGDAALLLALLGFRRLLGHPFPAFAQLGGWEVRFVDHLRELGPSVGPVGALVDAIAGRPVASMVAAGVVALLSGGLTEEFGWRGLAQVHLAERQGVLRASLLVGVMWGLWHLGPWPLFFTLPPAEAAAINLRHVLEYQVDCVALAVVVGWVFHHTRGSVLLAILFHAAHNTVVSVAFRAWDDFPYDWWLGAVVAAAVVVTALDRRALLRRPSVPPVDQTRLASAP